MCGVIATKNSGKINLIAEADIHYTGPLLRTICASSWHGSSITSKMNPKALEEPATKKTMLVTDADNQQRARRSSGFINLLEFCYSLQHGGGGCVYLCAFRL